MRKAIQNRGRNNRKKQNNNNGKDDMTPAASGDSESASSSKDGGQRRKPTQEEAVLTAKNYRLAKELSELRVRHREETKNVTRLTMENMNLASRCREAISHVALLKKELAFHQRRAAEALALQRQQVHRTLSFAGAGGGGGDPSSDSAVDALATGTASDGPANHNSTNMTNANMTTNSNATSTTNNRSAKDVEEEMERMDRLLADHAQSQSTKSESAALTPAAKTALPTTPQSKTSNGSGPLTPDSDVFGGFDTEPDAFLTATTSKLSSELSRDDNNRNNGKNGERDDAAVDEFMDDDDDIGFLPKQAEFFPTSASPSVEHLKSDFNEAFPDDLTKHHKKRSSSRTMRASPGIMELDETSTTSNEPNSSQPAKDGGTVSSTGNGSSGRLTMSSIDAFEASFETPFPSSFSKFTVKEDTAQRSKTSEKEKNSEIYNPFFASPATDRRKTFDDKPRLALRGRSPVGREPPGKTGAKGMPPSPRTKFEPMDAPPSPTRTKPNTIEAGVNVGFRKSPPSPKRSPPSPRPPSPRSHGEENEKPSGGFLRNALKVRTDSPSRRNNSGRSTSPSSKKGSRPDSPSTRPESPSPSKKSGRSNSPSLRAAVKSLRSNSQRFFPRSGPSSGKDSPTTSPEKTTRPESNQDSLRTPPPTEKDRGDEIEEPKRPEKTASASARARYEKALQPRSFGSTRQVGRLSGKTSFLDGDDDDDSELEVRHKKTGESTKEEKTPSLVLKRLQQRRGKERIDVTSIGKDRLSSDASSVSSGHSWTSEVSRESLGTIESGTSTSQVEHRRQVQSRVAARAAAFDRDTFSPSDEEDSVTKRPERRTYTASALPRKPKAGGDELMGNASSYEDTLPPRFKTALTSPTTSHKSLSPESMNKEIQALDAIAAGSCVGGSVGGASSSVTTAASGSAGGGASGGGSGSVGGGGGGGGTSSGGGASSAGGGGSITPPPNSDAATARFLAGGKIKRNIKQPVSYTEPSLNSKIRRGDVYFPKQDSSDSMKDTDGGGGGGGNNGGSNDNNHNKGRAPSLVVVSPNTPEDAFALKSNSSLSTKVGASTDEVLKDLAGQVAGPS